jgi:quercetin dioxygenase-like cupin family protein
MHARAQPRVDATSSSVRIWARLPGGNPRSGRDERLCFRPRRGCRTRSAHGRQHARNPLRETVPVAADEPIRNLPEKRLVSHIVDYPDGASSAAHRHAQSAFIDAYVLSGQTRSQVDGEPVRLYRAGESWFENQGAFHRVSANASDTDPARLLAVLIVDATDEQLVIPHNQ